MLHIAFWTMFALISLMFMADFFPVWANKATSVAQGTMAYPFAESLAQILKLMADVAKNWLGVLYHLLAGIGVDVESLKRASESVEGAASGAANQAIHSAPSVKPSLHPGIQPETIKPFIKGLKP